LITAALLTLTLAATTARAQTIAGRAVDQLTHLAIRTVAIEVLTERDTVVSLTKTDTLGEFYASVPSPGSFRVRFIIDSLHHFDSAAISVGDGEFVQRIFVIDVTPIFFEFQVEKQVQMVPHLSIPPRYPESLLKQNIEGEVFAQFVVDTTGEVLLETFRALRSTDPLFTEAVRAALPRFHFLPAEKGGRRVRQMVQQPYTFGIAGGPHGSAIDDSPWPPPDSPGSITPLRRPWP
jgi:TonB family protein